MYKAALMFNYCMWREILYFIIVENVNSKSRIIFIRTNAFSSRICDIILILHT
jgi:hypothetical protein